MRFVAGRGCHGEAAGTDSRRKQLAGSTAAESHREAVAGWGAVAELLVRAAGGSSSPGHRGKETGDAMAESHREESATARLPSNDANFGKECTFAA